MLLQDVGSDWVAHASQASYYWVVHVGVESQPGASLGTWDGFNPSLLLLTHRWMQGGDQNVLHQSRFSEL